jgi:hypothetical protein
MMQFFLNAARAFQLGWAISMIQDKIDAIKNLENPKDAGGRRSGKWVYPCW